MILMLVLLGCVLFSPFVLQGSSTRRVARVQSPSASQITPPVSERDLETGISDLATVYPGTYGISVYDPASGLTYGFNENETFAAASLSKLPVMLALYRDVAAGRIDLEESITMQSYDVQDYGAGVLQEYPVGYTMTLRECVELMIKESDNTAWVMLERRLGWDRISAELSTLGATNTDYATRMTTPSDVMLMLQAISDPSYTSAELSREMLSHMTDTAYENRIPAALPDDVRVAHKIGSWESTFSDAGIVYRSSDDGSGYFLVVMSYGTTEAVANRAIREVSKTIYDEL